MDVSALHIINFEVLELGNVRSGREVEVEEIRALLS